MNISAARWKKSSYSQGQNDCVEVATTATWKKSSHSQGQDDCVEVASGPGAVYLRDSKLGDASPVLSLSTTQWRAVLAAITAR